MNKKNFIKGDLNIEDKNNGCKDIKIGHGFGHGNKKTGILAGGKKNPPECSGGF